MGKSIVVSKVPPETEAVLEDGAKDLKEIKELLGKILVASESLYALLETKTLWNLADIAAYLGLKRTVVRDKLVKIEGFPTGYRPFSTRFTLWKSVEVKTWLLEQGMQE